MTHTHRMYECPDCNASVWIPRGVVQEAVDGDGVRCPCAPDGKRMQPVQGVAGEVRT